MTCTARDQLYAHRVRAAMDRPDWTSASAGISLQHGVGVELATSARLVELGSADAACSAPIAASIAASRALLTPGEAMRGAT